MNKVGVFHSRLLAGKVFVVDCGTLPGLGQTLRLSEDDLARNCAGVLAAELARHGAKVVLNKPRLYGDPDLERIYLANKYPQAAALIFWQYRRSVKAAFQVTVQRDEGTAGRLAKSIVQEVQAVGAQLSGSGIVEAPEHQIFQKTLPPVILTEVWIPSEAAADPSTTAQAVQTLVSAHVKAVLEVCGEQITTLPGCTYRRMRFEGTDIHLVILRQPQAAVVAAAKAAPETTSALAARYQARVAVNGGFFTDGRPDGPVIINGKNVGGKLLGPRAALGISWEGDFEIASVLQEADLEEFASALVAGPILVHGGRAQAVEENLPTEVPSGLSARSAVGLVDSKTILIAVADNRCPQDRGLTLTGMGRFLAARGAARAVNLAGGEAATLFFGDKVRNDPMAGKEQPVPNAFVIF